MPSRGQGKSEAQRQATIAAVRAGMKATVWCKSEDDARIHREWYANRLTFSRRRLIKFDWPCRVPLKGGRNAR